MQELLLDITACFYVYICSNRKGKILSLRTNIQQLANDINREDLVDLIRQRSEKGFSILYDNYSAALFGVIGRIVTDTASAEDILQDTFIKIWKSIDQYDDCKGTFFTWMLNIARNTSIDFVRSKQYQKAKRTSHGECLNNHEIGIISPDNTDHIGVRNIVAKLDAQYSEVIDLLYFNGYTQEEVAQALNIPLGTVKTRARKAVQILRNNF
jgi:RNA polymerase sigma-70 factor (ECF subfamily)